MLQLAVSSGFPLNVDASDMLSLIFKVLLLAVSLLYILFAILVMREISLMRRAVTVPNTSVVTLISLVHLILAVLLFLFFLLVL